MEEDVLIASGGWCAPLSALYDFGMGRSAWEYPDHPNLPHWDLIVAPRLTQALDMAYEARLRSRAAWRALTTPQREHDEDDEW